MLNGADGFGQPLRSACGRGACRDCPRALLNGQDGFPFLADGQPENVDLEPGTKLDRHVIQRRLGRGRIGDVYLATDTVSGTELAVKIVMAGPGCSIHAEHLRREKAAYDEIQDHRHVLKVFDLHEVAIGGAQLLILSMEYADGGTFRRWLNEHRDDHALRSQQGLVYFREICRGVAAIHDVGLAHLHLKPENVLLVRGQCKVADFCSAIGCGSVTGKLFAADSLCQDIVGTPLYMSPEHFTAAHLDDLDGRADIYSLGAILHELLHPNARPPFGGSYDRLRELHTSVTPPPLTGAGEVHRRVVARCLQKDPAARHQQVVHLLDALGGAPDPADAPTPPDLVDGIWAQARACIGQRQFAQAQQLGMQILRLRPEHADAQALVQEIGRRDQQAQQLYAAIEQGLENKGLAELTALLREAVELYPNHPSGHIAQIQLLARSREYRMAMSRGAEAVRAGAWVEARGYFLRAQQVNVGGLAATDAVCRTDRIVNELETMRRRIDEAIAEKEWRAAMAHARRLDEFIGGIVHANSPPQRGIRR